MCSSDLRATWMSFPFPIFIGRGAWPRPACPRRTPVNDLMGVNKLTLKELINKICEENSEKDAVMFDEGLVKFSELLQNIKRISAGLLNMGINKGTKVAILLNNRIEYVYAYFALFYVGAIPVPINNRWKSGERRQIGRASCRERV